MEMMKDGAANGVLDCSKAEYDILRQDVPWMYTDRNRARVALDAVLYGLLDMHGIARIALPAEYVAAAIVMFVRPVNIHQCCVAMSGSVGSTHSLFSGSAGSLFDLCLLAYSRGDFSSFAKRFDAAMAKLPAADGP